MSGQDEKVSALEPYFSALIVEDIDNSIKWYVDVLGMEVNSQNAIESIGLRQANLSNTLAALELIELGSAVSLSENLPGYTSKTRTIGLFKIGFRTKDFDHWLNHFEEKNVSFNGDVVTDPVTQKRMMIILDPDGNRIQVFEA